ncbi:MAG: hypothetical protein OEZ07_04485 [Dehalococcoidia bacterium]|nr:hypothetical protein [Dehalococcoidia bacterium]
MNTALIHTEYIFKQAILFCSEKLNETNEEILNLLRKGDSWFYSALRYALAKKFCRYIEVENITLKPVYIYGSSLEDTAPFTSNIDLILWVSQKAENLDSFLKDMDRCLAEHYSAIMGSSTKNVEGLLDFKAVDNEEEERLCKCHNCYT